MAFLTLTDINYPENLMVINLEQIVSMFTHKGESDDSGILKIIL